MFYSTTLYRSILPEVIVGLGAGIVTVPSSVAALAGVPAERAGVASALLNVSRQLGGALGLAVISILVAVTTTHGLAAGHATGAAMTAGFRADFIVSAVLLAAATAAALILLREDGRGQNVNLIELQTVGARPRLLSPSPGCGVGVAGGLHQRARLLITAEFSLLDGRCAVNAADWVTRWSTALAMVGVAAVAAVCRTSNRALWCANTA